MLKHQERDFASLQVLLIPDILVRRHHDFETGLLGGVDQFAIGEFFPTPRPRFLHCVAGKETGKTSWCAVIEKNQHPRPDLPVARGLFERTRYKRHEAV